MHIMEEKPEISELQIAQPSSPEQGVEEPPSAMMEETSNSSQQNSDSQPNEDIKPNIDKDIKLEEDCSSSNHSGEKRKSDGDSEDPPPKKRVHSELEQSYILRDRILNEYIDNAVCTSIQQVDAQMDQIMTDIKMMNELALEKEKEWNNIIHLKKMKEELLLRIQRRKQIMLLSNDPDASPETQPDILKNIRSSNGLLIFSTGQGKRASIKSNSNNFMDISNGFNGNSKLALQQRPVIDVQSIIADYRQRHPEAVPRRGRRIRPLTSSQGDNNAPINISSNARSTGQGSVINFSSISLGSGSQVKHNFNVANMDGSANGDVSVLISGSDPQEQQDILYPPTKPPPPYSEVTVHPVPMATQSSNSSLLHGILTKTHTKPENTKSTYSPTLARLLTAPDRSTIDLPQNHTPNASLSIGEMLTNNKARNEITITPVGGQFDLNTKEKGTLNDEEVEDTSDRLVIDESESHEMHNGLEEIVDEVPQCQGCNQKPAQFVCAGCGNQWYCSRECQVVAWDDHSEVCSG